MDTEKLTMFLMGVVVGFLLGIGLVFFLVMLPYLLILLLVVVVIIVLAKLMED